MDILSQHQALLFISSVPGVKELHSHSQTWLMSGCETAELLSIYRKILFVSQSQEEDDDHSVYCRLFPPGWCLLDSLEERHRRHWQTVSQLFKLDKIGQVFVQLLIIFGAEDFELESSAVYWATTARQYLEEHHHSSVEGNKRSVLGKMIMTRQYLREIHYISQLNSRN